MIRLLPSDPHPYFLYLTIFAPSNPPKECSDGIRGKISLVTAIFYNKRINCKIASTIIG